jgi:hypothetical protein
MIGVRGATKISITLRHLITHKKHKNISISYEKYYTNKNKNSIFHTFDRPMDNKHLSRTMKQDDNFIIIASRAYLQQN